MELSRQHRASLYSLAAWERLLSFVSSSRDKRYHVIHFDLRIAGFADLPSQPTSLTHQLRHLFDNIAKQQHHGKEALGVKVLVGYF